MTVFKIFGLLSVLLSSTSLGFYKSYTLNLRCRKLSEFCVSLEKLSHFITSSFKDLDVLLRESFGGEIDTSGISKEDKEILEKLFSEIGISDRQRDCNNVLMYKNLLEKQLETAEDDCKRLSRLYNSLGFLGGLSLCIFLI